MPMNEQDREVTVPAPIENPKTGTEPQSPPDASAGLGPRETDRFEPEVAPPDLPQGGQGVSDMNGPSSIRESPWGHENRLTGDDPRPDGSEPRDEESSDG